jgi:hypothetical protein
LFIIKKYSEVIINKKVQGKFMEKAKLYCQTFPKRFGKYRVSVLDLRGEEITGVLVTPEKQIEVQVLEYHEEKALVLFPFGMSKEIAWIKTNNLN